MGTAIDLEGGDKLTSIDVNLSPNASQWVKCEGKDKTGNNIEPHKKSQTVFPSVW